MKSELKEEILDLRDGDHFCLFYEKDPAEQMPALVPFVPAGRLKEERLIFIERMGDPAGLEPDRITGSKFWIGWSPQIKGQHGGAR